MKKFKVHISEVLGRDVYVKAEDFDEAYDIVDELCNSDIICLNGKDFDDRNIEVLCESDNLVNIKLTRKFSGIFKNCTEWMML